MSSDYKRLLEDFLFTGDIWKIFYDLKDFLWEGLWTDFCQRKNTLKIKSKIYLVYSLPKDALPIKVF